MRWGVCAWQGVLSKWENVSGVTAERGEEWGQVRREEGEVRRAKGEKWD